MELHEMLKLLRAHGQEATRGGNFPLPVACEKLSVACASETLSRSRWLFGSRFLRASR
jgi:hypothetical protein